MNKCGALIAALVLGLLAAGCDIRYPECSFEIQRVFYDPRDARDDARSEFGAGDVFLFGVNNGFGPSRPGYETIEVAPCLLDNVEWKYFSVGYDYMECSDHSNLEKQALDYAEAFNSEMMKLLSQSSTLECVGDLRHAN